MSRKMRLNVVSRRLLEENLFAFDVDEVPWTHSRLQTNAVVFDWNLVEELWTGVGRQNFQRARAHWLYTSTATANINKKASNRWQDSARRQFQAGLRGDVGF